MPTVNDVRHTDRTVGEFTIKSLTQFSAKSSFDFWNARFSVSQRSGRIVGYREAGRNWANNRLIS
jgi:allophanate hydrolase subunit 2